MNETTFDLSAIRHLRGLAEAGSAQEGQGLALKLQMEDGSAEWMVLHHARLGRLVASLLFAADMAAKDREAAGGESGSTLIDIVRVNAASAPGSDHLVLRMVVGEGANLDFRIPLDVVPALQARIAEAAAAAAASPPPN